MTRTEIYFAKVLAGLVPFVGLMILAAGLEVFACAAVGYKITARYLIGALFIFLKTIMPFILSFCISSAVMSNAGSLIEGSIFSIMTAFSSVALKTFFMKLFDRYTLGAGALGFHEKTTPEWNWSTPFLDNSTVIFDTYYDLGEAAPYFSIYSTEKISLYDWSGIITAIVYSVIAIVLGSIAFNKRRNEITGTFGRARGLNEICAVIAGIALFPFFNTSFYYGEGTVGEFIVCVLLFCVAYLVFKLIFGHKRRQELVKSLKRLPFYACGLTAAFLIFYFGALGYSSYIPPVSEIELVTVQSPMLAYLDDPIAAKADFGLKEQNIRDKIALERMEDYSLYERLFGSVYNGTYDYLDEYEYTTDYIYAAVTAVFSDTDEINQAIDIHRSIIADGHISGTEKDACGTSFVIKYQLKDGTEIIRSYFRTTEETAKKMLSLNNTTGLDNNMNRYFGSYYSADDRNDYLYESFSENVNKSSNVSYSECLLFPTDMSRGFDIGIISEEFFHILMSDILEQSADEHYHHTAEDEIGILAFNLSTAHGYFSEENLKLSETLGAGYATTSWNLNATDTKAIVVTKDMKNTIRYLQDNNLLQYFEKSRTADDISHVKLATMGELYGKKLKHLNIPVFYGAYSIRQTQAEVHYFEKIEEKTENKAEIQALLDKAVVFGYCSNDSQIMEITYNDGVVATMMIPAS
ncbi:MAG: ABC transporter permease [Clostridia bacterium]|nr:ABC transporter permease [Clostridia bacterium]